MYNFDMNSFGFTDIHSYVIVVLVSTHIIVKCKLVDVSQVGSYSLWLLTLPNTPSEVFSPGRQIKK